MNVTKSDRCRQLIKDDPGRPTTYYATHPEVKLPATMVSAIRNEKKSQVYEMYESGLSAAEIAKELNHPEIEVDRMIGRYHPRKAEKTEAVAAPANDLLMTAEERLDQMAQWCEHLKAILRSNADDAEKYRQIKQLTK